MQETEQVNDVLQDSLDECYLTPSSDHDLPDTHRPPRSSAVLFDDSEIDLALDEAREYSIVKRMNFHHASQKASYSLCSPFLSRLRDVPALKHRRPTLI